MKRMNDKAIIVILVVAQLAWLLVLFALVLRVTGWFR